MYYDCHVSNLTVKLRGFVSLEGGLNFHSWGCCIDGALWDRSASSFLAQRPVLSVSLHYQKGMHSMVMVLVYSSAAGAGTHPFYSSPGRICFFFEVFECSPALAQGGAQCDFSIWFCNARRIPYVACAREVKKNLAWALWNWTFFAFRTRLT